MTFLLSLLILYLRHYLNLNMLHPRVNCSAKELGSLIGLSPPEYKEFKVLLHLLTLRNLCDLFQKKKTLRDLAQEHLNMQKTWAQQRESDTTTFLDAVSSTTHERHYE